MTITGCEEDIFEPEEWTGEPCTDEQIKDVNDDNRGPGSCRFDCDCPPCAPFCNSLLGSCDNDKSLRTESSRSECYESDTGGHFSVWESGNQHPCIRRCKLKKFRTEPEFRCVHKFFPRRGKC